MRGERRFRCGCGSDLSETQNATWILIRNLWLLAILAAASMIAEETSRGWSWDLLAGYLAGVGMALSARLVGAAFRSWEFIREWKASG